MQKLKFGTASQNKLVKKLIIEPSVGVHINFIE